MALNAKQALFDGHNDADNAEFWRRWNAEVFKAIREGRDDYLVFEAAVREHAPDLLNTVFLREDQSHKLLGIECGEHGHRGKNGSKGGHKNYRGRGCKVNRADQHSAGIYFDTFTAGASAMKTGYNRGPSSWSHSLIVTYENVGRTIVTLNADGRWRGAPLPAEKPRYRVKAFSSVDVRAAA